MVYLDFEIQLGNKMKSEILTHIEQRKSSKTLCWMKDNRQKEVPKIKIQVEEASEQAKPI